MPLLEKKIFLSRDVVIIFDALCRSENKNKPVPWQGKWGKFPMAMESIQIRGKFAKLKN